ncbi:MAG: type II toxin-antitoxin system RelE/ParE family toxin [Verrucomicrobia bacterium]|nr:type II toxin-antitoxin system RelE/ParE family toxin [Verrucomicrobiota bacterium]
MKIEILDDAKADLIAGYHFYEEQSSGLGSYFLDSLFSDIDSLLLYAGIHRVVFGSHRCVARRFPFAIYYRIESDVVRVRAVLDCRRDPKWIRRRMQRAS